MTLARRVAALETERNGGGRPVVVTVPHGATGDEALRLRFGAAGVPRGVRTVLVFNRPGLIPFDPDNLSSQDSQ